MKDEHPTPKECKKCGRKIERELLIFYKEPTVCNACRKANGHKGGTNSGRRRLLIGIQK